MRQYLHVSAGPYPLLLDAEGIHEILDLSHDHADTAGHRDWRGQVLTTINIRTLLGMKDDTLPLAHAGVVYSVEAGEPPVMLEMDKVERLRLVDDSSLVRLPRVPDAASGLFDCVLPDKNRGLQIYHLRRPLSLEVFTHMLETMPDSESTQIQPVETEEGVRSLGLPTAEPMSPSTDEETSPSDNNSHITADHGKAPRSSGRKPRRKKS
jgi:hypothetical protein